MVAERARVMVSSGARVHSRLATSSWVVGCRHCSLMDSLHVRQVFQSRNHQSCRLERHILALAAQCDSGKRGWGSTRHPKIPDRLGHPTASSVAWELVCFGASAAAVVVAAAVVEASAVDPCLS